MAASRIGTQYIFLARIVARGRLDDGDSLARGFEGRGVRTAKIQGCTIGLDWLVPRGRVRIGACHPLWTLSQSGHANRGYRPILRHPFVVHRPVGESVAPRLGAFGVV